jgi:hypothetical protein
LIAAAERWYAARAGAGAEPAELDALLRPRPAAGALSALDRLGDPELLVVRLIREIGPERALAILPPVLARAVRGLRDVARLLSGPSLDR